METLLSLWPWNLVKIILGNPEKWQNSVKNDPENPENGVKKWLDTLWALIPKKVASQALKVS